MYFLLTYTLTEDYLEKRAAHRGMHVKLVLASREKGTFFMGGALDNAKQAFLVFKTEDISEVETFVENDPYVNEGLVKKWSIEKWNVAVSPNEIYLPGH